MKHLRTLLFFVALAQASLFGQTTKWVSAYYAGWMQSYLPPSAVDFSAVTHVMHFSIEPTGAGNITGTANGITSGAIQAVVTAAHAAGKKVLITCGGYGDDQGFVTCTNSTNRTTFVTNLVNFVVNNNYDGLDIDWEPVTSPSQFKLFIPQLRAALTAAKPGLLLTIAVLTDDLTVADVASSFDQINIMTYDMSGAWPGWVSWFNSPIYDGGFRFPSTNGLVPSADGQVDEFSGAGIPKSKLGIGTDFYGYIWSGVSQPRQGWTGSGPTVSGNVAYSDLMNTYSGNPVVWDSAAGAAYISITTGSGKFISLDNEQTMAAKADYIRKKGIGGIIIWELGGGYRANQPAGSRDKLLQAVKVAFLSSSTPVEPPLANAQPLDFRLDQNFPNPFNPSTTIGYSLPRAGHVTLKVFDALGNEVATLVDDQKEAGTYRTTFDGSSVASGTYFYRIQAGEYMAVKKLLLLK